MPVWVVGVVHGLQRHGGFGGEEARGVHHLDRDFALGQGGESM